MHIIQTSLPGTRTPDLDALSIKHHAEQCLYFDIETTGLSAKTSFVYLIGCMYLEQGAWQLRQWYISKSNEEFEMLENFFAFIRPFTCIIHYNGRSFDLPYLQNKARAYLLPEPFSGKDSVDLYSELRPYAKVLGMDTMRLPALEQRLGIQRQDHYSGKELIPIYHSWQKTKTPKQLDKLLLHNQEDITSLMAVTESLAVPRILTGSFSLQSSQNTETDYVLRAKTTAVSPIQIKYCTPFGALTLQEQMLCVTLPLKDHSFRLYYPNVKDYVYFPKEDMAILKTLAMNRDKNICIPATIRTCYQWIHMSAGQTLPSREEERILRYYMQTLLLF